MAPTIVLAHGRPFLAVGSPGGSTIITTVLQILVNRLDLGMSLPEAIAAPRAVAAQHGDRDRRAGVHQLAGGGRRWPRSATCSRSMAEIGAATGVEFLGHGKLVAAAEPVRRGSGSAGVVHP